MVDFVLEQQKEHLSLRDFNIRNYANFLKQLLQLWMFVACDEDGNVLEEPKDFKVWSNSGGAFMNIDEVLICQEYQQAKERCLFDGFENGFRIPEHKVFNAGDLIFNEEETIENLLQYKNKTFKLTPTALK